MADKPDYRAILTQLYQRYNPEKVRDVDFLLKKFEGREAEMIDKIQRKYAALEPFTSPVPPPATSEGGGDEPSGKGKDAGSDLPKEKSAPQTEGGKEKSTGSSDGQKPKSGKSGGKRKEPKVRTKPEAKPKAKPETRPGSETGKGSSSTTPKAKTKGKPKGKSAVKPREAQEVSRPKRSGRRIIGFSLIGLLIGAGAFAAWYFWGGDSPIIKKQFLYVVADTVFTHSECDLGLESRLRPFPYGEAIEVKGLEESCITTRVDGKVEYVPKKFLGSKREFEEIDAIYGNPESRDLFDNSYEKRALRNYFNRTQIMGDIPHKMQVELYGQPREREVWQVFGMGLEDGEEEVTMDAVAKGRFSWGNQADLEDPGNRPEDFAVIISERENRDRRKLLLFNFDEDKIDNFVDEMDLSNYPGFLIRPIQYKEEIFLFGTPYLTLDAKRENEEEEISLALLLQKPGIDDHRYLVEVVQGELQLFSLDKGLFKMYKKDRIYQP